MAKILPISENGFQLFRRTSTFLFFRTDINLDKNLNLAVVAACPFLYLFECLQAMDRLDPIYPGCEIFDLVGLQVSDVVPDSLQIGRASCRGGVESGGVWVQVV